MATLMINKLPDLLRPDYLVLSSSRCHIYCDTLVVSVLSKIELIWENLERNTRGLGLGMCMMYMHMMYYIIMIHLTRILPEGSS